jgi:DNA-binding MarR family transcriptional regulator
MARTLREELKQNKPFRTLEEEATVNITRTAAVLEHWLAQALKPFGVTPTQYNVLRILRGAGDEGLCRNAVGERLIRQVPDVTRLLDRMEKDGLIVRQRSREDRRHVTTRITPKGEAIVEKLDPELCAIHRRHLGRLDQKQLRALIDVLTEARQA